VQLIRQVWDTLEGDGSLRVPSQTHLSLSASDIRLLSSIHSLILTKTQQRELRLLLVSIRCGRLAGRHALVTMGTSFSVESQTCLYSDWN